MHIQDIYVIGTRVHQLLIHKGLNHKVMTPAQFRAMWEETRNQIRDDVESGRLELIGDSGSIDWNLFLEDGKD